MDAERQAKYLELRRKASVLNCSGNFGFESIELVEQLVNLVESTTSSYNVCREREARLAADLSLAQAQLFPLRKENARLDKELHQLRIESMKDKDTEESSAYDHTSELNKLKDQLSELQYLSKIKDDRLNYLEAEKNRILASFESLQKNNAPKKVMKLSNQLTPSRNSATKSAAIMETTFYTRDVESSSSSLSHSTGSRSQTSAQAAAMRDPDLVTIEALQLKLAESSKEVDKLRETNGRLVNAVKLRENELMRSARAPNGPASDPSTLNAAPSRLDQLVAVDTSNRVIIDQLNAQVDFLNDQLAMREAQLVEVSQKMFDAQKMVQGAPQYEELIERYRVENAALTSKVRHLDSKITDITQAMDVDGEVSAAELFKLLDKNLGRLPTFRESKENARDNTVVAAVTSGRLKVASQPKSNSATSRVLKSVKARDAESVASSVTNSDAGAAGVSKEGDEHASAISQSTVESILRSRLLNGETKIAQLSSTVAELQRQIDSHASAAGTRDQLLEQTQREKAQLRAALQDAGAKLAMRVGTSEELTAKVQVAESAMKALASEKEALERLLQDMRKEQAVLRQDKDAATISLENTVARLKKFESSSGAQTAQLQASLQDLSEARKEAVILRLENDKLQDKLSSERKRYEASASQCADMETEVQQVRAELADASKRLAAAQSAQQYAAAEREQTAEAAQSERSRIHALEDEIIELRHENALLEDALNARARVRTPSSSSSPEFPASALPTSLTPLPAAASVSVEAIEAWKEERTELTRALAAKAQEVETAQRELRKAQIELDNSTKRALAQDETSLRLQATCESLEDELGSAEQRVRQVEDSNRLLEKRLRDAMDEYSETTDCASVNAEEAKRWAAKCAQLEQSASQSAEQLASLQLEHYRLRDDHEDLKRQLDALSRRAAAERSSAHRAQQALDGSDTKADELKVLVGHMENSARVSAERQARLVEALNESDETIKKLEDTAAHLRDELGEKDRKLRETRDEVDAALAERDRMARALAQEDQANDKRLARLQQLESHAAQARGALQHCEDRLDDALGEVSRAHQQAAVLSKQLSAAHDEAAELARRLDIKTGEVNAAAEDLLLMTRENQAVTTELAQVSSERDQMRSRLQRQAHEFAKLQQDCRGMQLERVDLLKAYREALDDKRLLESDLNAMGSTKEHSGKLLQEAREQAAVLRAKLEAYASAEARWSADKTAHARQMADLNDTIVRTQTALEAVTADNRRMMQDLHNARQSNSMLTDRVQLVIKRAAMASDSSKVLASRLALVERERDAVRALNETERRRSAELGRIVQYTREENMRSSPSLTSVTHSPAAPTPLEIIVTGDVGGGGGDASSTVTFPDAVASSRNNGTERQEDLDLFKSNLDESLGISDEQDSLNDIAPVAVRK